MRFNPITKIALAILLGAIIGYFIALSGYLTTPAAPNQLTSPKASNIEPAVDSQLKSDDFVSYSNTEAGYSFLYPKDWELDVKYLTNPMLYMGKPDSNKYELLTLSKSGQNIAVFQYTLPSDGSTGVPCDPLNHQTNANKTKTFNFGDSPVKLTDRGCDNMSFTGNFINQKTNNSDMIFTITYHPGVDEDNFVKLASSIKGLQPYQDSL